MEISGAEQHTDIEVVHLRSDLDTQEYQIELQKIFLKEISVKLHGKATITDENENIELTPSLELTIGQLVLETRDLVEYPNPGIKLLSFRHKIWIEVVTDSEKIKSVFDNYPNLENQTLVDFFQQTDLQGSFCR